MIRHALSCIFALLVCAGPVRAMRPPLQSDVDRCALSAQNMGHDSALQGRLRLQLLVRRDGKVYAAHVQSQKGIGDRALQRCLTSVALLWELAPAPLDYAWPYVLSFAPGGSSFGRPFREGTSQSRASVFLPDINAPPGPAPLDVEAAQATLDVTDGASQAEHGVGELSVRSYAKAIGHFRSALEGGKQDPTALRGLAQALAESGGDLNEARALAERLISLDPQSEQGHEALLRVCLAANDDRCVVQQFNLANASKDAGRRSHIFLKDELLAPAQKASDRVRAAIAAEGKGGSAPAPQDPCVKEQGEEAQALCVVRRCLDEGTVLYAKELSEQNRVDYVAGDWRTKKVSAARLVVTRPIEPKQGQSAPGHDAIWLVKLGEQLVMLPSNPEARQITLNHNRCGAQGAR